MSHTLLLIFFFLIFSFVLDLKEKNPGDLWHEFPHCAVNAQLLYQLVQSWGWAKKKGYCRAILCDEFMLSPKMRLQIVLLNPVFKELQFVWDQKSTDNSMFCYALNRGKSPYKSQRKYITEQQSQYSALK